MLAAGLSAGLVTTNMLMDIASCEGLFHTASGTAARASSRSSADRISAALAAPPVAW